jgi:hypothetical protein
MRLAGALHQQREQVRRVRVEMQLPVRHGSPARLIRAAAIPPATTLWPHRLRKAESVWLTPSGGLK